MPRMLQVRNIPEDLHRELLRRARERGMTLTGYVQEILEREVARRPLHEVYASIRSRDVELERPVAEVVREARREEFGES